MLNGDDVAGPGLFITAELVCGYVGGDASAEAIAVTRERTARLACRFAVSPIPPVPPGPFDAVLLLETMLAFPDKATLLAGVCAALRPGGCFAFTLEAGLPLSAAERERMPAADTVWLTPLPELLADLPGSACGSGNRSTARSPTWPWSTRCAPRSQTRRRTSPLRSGRAPWTICSPPTGSGATGCGVAGSGSSRSRRSGGCSGPVAPRGVDGDLAEGARRPRQVIALLIADASGQRVLARCGIRSVAVVWAQRLG